MKKPSARKAEAAPAPEVQMEEPPELICIENIAAVEDVAIPVRPGCVTVLRGTNGAGKSEALRAIRAMTVDEETRKKNYRLQVRDGADEGEISGLGIAIHISRSGINKRTGLLSVSAVEDSFDLSQFVDPGLKDPAAADVRRLKTLASMMGIRADQKKVAELLGGQSIFDAVISTETRQTVGAVDFIEGAKADTESAARESEQAVTKLDAQISVLRGQIDGVDQNATADEKTLADAHQKAVEAKAALDQRVKDAAEMKLVREAAKAVLDGDSGQTLAEATTVHQNLLDEITRLETRLEELRKQAEEKQKAVESARLREESRRKATEAIAKAATTEPTAEELEAAQKAVDAAGAAVLAGAKIRDAKATQTKLDGLLADRKAELELAEQLRQAAGKMVDLLAEPVNELKCGVRVTKAMRLVVEGHRRGRDVFLSELSPGEGWSVAMGLALMIFEKAGVPGILGVPQPAFEGLDGHNLLLFRQAVARTKLRVVTAKASEQPDEYIPVTPELLPPPATE